MKNILLEVQKDLEMNSHIDLESDLNDLNKYPDGSYSKLEHLLFKFGMVTEIPPRISDSEISKSLAEVKYQKSSENELSKRRKIEQTSKPVNQEIDCMYTTSAQYQTCWAKVSFSIGMSYILDITLLRAPDMAMDEKR